MGFMVLHLCRVEDLGFTRLGVQISCKTMSGFVRKTKALVRTTHDSIQGLGSRSEVPGSVIRVRISRFRVQGLGFRV